MFNADEFLPRVTSDLDRVTTHAAALPPGSDLAFHRVMNRQLGQDIDDSSATILRLANDLLELVRTASKSKVQMKIENEDDVMGGYRRGVVDGVNTLLEDADSCLDEIRGQKKQAAFEIKPSLVAAAGKKLPGPFVASSQTTSDKVPSAWGDRARTLPRPQLQFPDPVDNAYDRPQFIPSLPVKHHAMVPINHPAILEYTIDSDPDRARAQLELQKRMIRHPYHYETNHLPYPTSMFTLSPPIEPKPLAESTPEWVDTPEALAHMVEDLMEAKEIAVDLEHHSTFSYYGFTCLMQISTRDKDWLVDTLKLRGALREEKLGGVFADPSIVKVFHGASLDITWLQKDFDIYVVNLFDTYDATHVLGMQSHSLASLLERFCDYRADKRYQLADWRIRPLTAEMQQYAQADTHFLLYIYDNLRNSLLEQSRPPSPSTTGPGGSRASSPATNPQRAMRRVLERSAITALKLYERFRSSDAPEPEAGWTTPFRRNFHGDASLDSREAEVFRRLWVWADGLARQEDVDKAAILSIGEMVRIAALRQPDDLSVRHTLQRDNYFAPLHFSSLRNAVDQGVQSWVEKVGRAESVKNQKESEGSSLVGQASPPTDQLPPASAASSSAVGKQPATQATAAATGAAAVASNVEVSWSLPVASGSSKSTRTTTSKLFGGPKVADHQPRASTVQKASSSLFGRSLPRHAVGDTARDRPDGQRERVRAEFDAARQSILQDFAPPRLIGTVETTPDVTNSRNTTPRLPAVETVPYVPAAERQTIAQPVKDKASTAFAQPIEPAAVGEAANGQRTEKTVVDKKASNESVEVVNVKRSKKAAKKRQAEQSTAVDTPDVLTASYAREDPVMGSATALDGPVASSSEPAKKKRKSAKKAKVDAIGEALLDVEDPAPVSTSAAAALDAPLEPAPEATGKKKRKASKKAKAHEDAGSPIDDLDDTLATASTTAKPAARLVTDSSEDITKRKSPKADKGKGKAKIDPASIPSFDYSSVPNLLDNPKEATASRKRPKSKKERGTPVNITGSTFGQATQDKSQPKAGNKSRTFL